MALDKAMVLQRETKGDMMTLQRFTIIISHPKTSWNEISIWNDTATETVGPYPKRHSHKQEIDYKMEQCINNIVDT